jgi:hypothetical protein
VLQVRSNRLLTSNAALVLQVKMPSRHQNIRLNAGCFRLLSTCGGVYSTPYVVMHRCISTQLAARGSAAQQQDETARTVACMCEVHWQHRDGSVFAGVVQSAARGC